MHHDDSGRPLRLFLTFYRPHRRLFALDLLFSLLSCLADLAFPYVSRQAMQHLLPLGLFRTFFAIMAALLAAYLLKAVFKYAVTVIGHQCGVLIEADMRQELFEHLQTMSFRFFDCNRTGVLMSRMTSDLFSITELAHHGPEYLLTAVVTLGGIDVRTVTQASLRRCVGVLQQEVFLFADTIRENIRYGRPDATDAEIEQAARYAEIDREIRAMPDGYDTYVGERGVMLSGGQKQRLSIARLFLKNPQILILDEATSALDSVTEQRIQHALDTLARGRTCIIIAHRLSTVQGADRVAVIDGAHVCEQGTPAELIARDGKYAALCRAQHLI